MRAARLWVTGCALFLLFAWGIAQVQRQEVRGSAGERRPVTLGERASASRSVEEAQDPPIFGAITTVAAGNPAPPQQIFGSRADVILAGGPVSTPCQFPQYLPDGTYYFQVTDPSGTTLLSTDVVSERSVTVTM